MKKFINKLETKLGVDIDGDGSIGGVAPSKPPQQSSGYPGQPPHQGYPQQGYPQGYQQQPSGPVMQFHQGNGIKKALLVGINYTGQQGELRGCINDVHLMRNFIHAHGYNPQNMRILVDDPSQGSPMPTRQNIIQGIQWLIAGASPGDNLFFHYSGHGSRVKDLDGDEADGYDETIVPCDFRSAGQITDDELFNVLVQPLAPGVRLTAVMDCCHSGTVLDLPFEFTANRRNMQLVFQNGKFNPAALPSMVFNYKWDLKDKKKLQQQAVKFGMDLAGQFFGKTGHGGGGGGGQPGFQQNQKKEVRADVILFSGCADSQTSADVQNTSSFNLPSNAGPGQAGGACTNALVAAYSSRPNVTFIQLLEDMRIMLEQKGFRQVPQLSSSRPLDLAAPFSL